MAAPLGISDFLRGRGPAPNGADAVARAAAEGAGRPRGRRLDEAWAVWRAHEDAPAWPRLIEAGLLPPSWLDDPHRRFVNKRVYGVLMAGVSWGGENSVTVIDRSPDGSPGVVEALPPGVVSPAVRSGALVRAVSVPEIGPESRYIGALEPEPRNHLAVALAGDAEGAAAAEEFAMEAAWRLLPWGFPAPALIAWELLPHGYLSARQMRAPLAPLWPGSYLPLRAAAAADAVGLCGLGPSGVAARPLVIEHLRWRRAVEEGARVPSHAPAGAAGARFGDLPDPFEPLLAIAALGYSALHAEGFGPDCVIRLFAPPPVPPRGY